MTEDEQILEDRYRVTTWKDWALILCVNVVIYFVVSAIASTG